MHLPGVKTNGVKSKTMLRGSHQSNSFYNQNKFFISGVKRSSLLLFGISSVCLRVDIKMYFSAFPEEFPVLRCCFFKLLKKKVIFPEEFFSHAMWSLSWHHFLRLSEFSHEPSSSTSRWTTRSISATSWDSCSLRNELRETQRVTEEKKCYSGLRQRADYWSAVF